MFRFIFVPVASTNGSPCHLYHHRANLQHITPTETQTHSPPPSFPKESFGMRCPFICDGKLIAHSTNYEGACSAPGSRSRSRPKPGDDGARARAFYWKIDLEPPSRDGCAVGVHTALHEREGNRPAPLNLYFISQFVPLRLVLVPPRGLVLKRMRGG